MRLPVIPSALLAFAMLSAYSPVFAQDALPGPKTFTRKKDRKAAPAVPPVDINHATREELRKLPGITEALADKIIAGRPYKSKVHLVTHGVLAAGLYDQLKRRIIAKQD